jgi:hypothetical protein
VLKGWLRRLAADDGSNVSQLTQKSVRANVKNRGMDGRFGMGKNTKQGRNWDTQ